jgi:predicted secreted protein
VNPITGVAIYFVIWWTVLFAVLPWGARAPDNPEPGMAESAPARPRLLLKFLVTSALSGVIWLIIYAVVVSGVISFRDIVAGS